MHALYLTTGVLAALRLSIYDIDLKRGILYPIFTTGTGDVEDSL